MPVQRLPRYVLLMTDLKKYTAPGHPDVEYLTELLPKLQATVSELNKGIDPQKEANMSKNIEIAKSISGEGVEDIVRGERVFVMEGPIKQMCAVSAKTGKEKSSHKGYCFLFNNLIVLCSLSGKKDDKPYTLWQTIEGQSIVNIIFPQKTSSFRLTFRLEDAFPEQIGLSPSGSATPSPSPSPSLPEPESRSRSSSGDPPNAEAPGVSTFLALTALRSQASAAQLLISSKVSAAAPMPTANEAMIKAKKTQKTVIMKVATSEECKEWEERLAQFAKVSRDSTSSTISANSSQSQLPIEDV